MKKSQIIILTVVLAVVALVIGVFIGKSLPFDKEATTDDLSTTIEQLESVADTTEKQTDEDTVPESETAEETETEAQTEPQAEVDVIAETISTDYYSIGIPASWQGKYSYVVTDKNEDGSYSLTVRHKDSYGSGYGGNLFTISLYSVADGAGQSLIENAPVPVEYLGVLKVQGVADFDVIVTFPSDAQFNESTMDGYNELFNSKNAVLESLEASAGSAFENE